MWARGGKRLGAVFDTWKKYTNPKCKYLNIQIRVQCAFFFAVGNVTSHCYGCYCRHKNKRSSKLYAECLNCRDDFCHNLSFCLYCASSGSWELNVKPQYKLFPFLLFIVFCYKFLNSTFTYVGIDFSDKPTINELFEKENENDKESSALNIVWLFWCLAKHEHFFKMKTSAVRKTLEKSNREREKNVHRQLEKTTFIRIGWVSFNVNVKRKQVFFYKSTLNT